MPIDAVAKLVRNLTSLRGRMAGIPVLREQIARGDCGPFAAPTDGQVREAERQLRIVLPAEYVELLRSLHEGLPPMLALYWIGGGKEEIVSENRRLHERWAPGTLSDSNTYARSLPVHLVAFADNAGLDVFAFDASAKGRLGEMPVVAWRQCETQEPLAPSFVGYIEREVDRLSAYCAAYENAVGKLEQLRFRNPDSDVDDFGMALPGTRPPILRLEQAQQLVWTAHLRKGRWDPIIDEMLGGYALNDPSIRLVGGELMAQGQSARAKRLWKGVAAQRLAEHRRRVKDGRRETDLADSLSMLTTAWREYAAVLRALGEDSTEAERTAVEISAGRLPKPMKIVADRRRMDESLFWGLIHEARRETDGPAEQVEVLARKLEAFGTADIRRFQTLLDEALCQLNHWDVWALAYLRNGGCSDDGFEYFRAGLVLLGRDVVQAATGDVAALAERLPAGGSLECEALLSVAQAAQQAKTGKPLRAAHKRCPLKGRAWEEGELRDRYPVLCAMLGEGAGRAVAGGSE